MADKNRRTRVLGLWLTVSPAVSLLAVLLYAAAGHFNKGSTFWSVFGIGFITAAAAFVIGALLGFLFGLPRTIEQSGSKALLQTNTNLDQISDWLTKILVGIGLVQVNKIAKGVNALAASLVPGLGGHDGAHAFASAVLGYSAVDGFLVGYLWTRIVVSIRLTEAAENLARSGAITTEVLSSPPPAAPPPLPPPPLPPPPTPAAPAGPRSSADGGGGGGAENPEAELAAHESDSEH